MEATLMKLTTEL